MKNATIWIRLSETLRDRMVEVAERCGFESLAHYVRYTMELETERREKTREKFGGER